MEGNQPNLLDLPMDILEKIVLCSDCHSVIRLGFCSKSSQSIVRRILSGKAGMEFWKKECVRGMGVSMYRNIMGSFFTEVRDGSGVASRSKGFFDARKTSSYRQVFLSMFNLQYNLKFSDLQIEQMTNEQEGIETEYLNDMWTWSNRIINTVGPNLYHISGFPTRFYLVDGRKTIRTESMATGQLLDYRIMSLPVIPPRHVLDSSTKIRKPLLKAWKIFIGIFQTEIHLIPFNYGKPCSFVTRAFPYFGEYEMMPPPVAVLDDMLAVWECPNLYSLHLIEVNPTTGDVSQRLLDSIFLTAPGHIGMMEVWNLISRMRKDFLATLSLNTYSFYYEPDGNSTAPIFSLVSPTLGTVCFNDDNSNHPVESYDPNIVLNPGVPEGSAFHSPIGHADSQGTILFWSEDYLTVAFGKTDWYLEKWEAMGVFQTVTLIEVIAPRIIMLNTKDQIIIIKLRYGIPHEPKNGYKPGPLPYKKNCLDFEIIRRIDTRSLHFDSENNTPSFIKYLHFDFDQGKPYIFIDLVLPSDLTVFGPKRIFKKILFSKHDETKGSGKGNKKEPFKELRDSNM